MSGRLIEMGSSSFTSWDKNYDDQFSPDLSLTNLETEKQMESFTGNYESFTVNNELATDIVDTFINEEIFLREDVKIKKEIKEEDILFQNENEVISEERVDVKYSDTDLEHILGNGPIIKQEKTFKFRASLITKCEDEEKNSSFSDFPQQNTTNDSLVENCWPSTHGNENQGNILL